MTAIFNNSYAAYYDLLYKDKDYQGEADFICKFLERSGVKEGDILELGCGTGKHAELIARNGYGVHGVDQSPKMVSTAIERRPSDLVDRCQFEEGDVRTVDVGRKFNAVISLFHVASYQTSTTDLLAMFETASKHLDAGGIFIFDFWYGPAVLTEMPAVRIKRLSGDGVNILRIAEPNLHHESNVVDVNYTVFSDNDGVNQTVICKEKHEMRYLFLPELQFFLAQKGFSVKENVEWMSGAKLELGSWSAMVVAVKD